MVQVSAAHAGGPAVLHLEEPSGTTALVALPHLVVRLDDDDVGGPPSRSVGHVPPILLDTFQLAMRARART